MPDQYYEVVSTVATEYRTVRSEPYIKGTNIGRLEAGTKAKAYTTDVKVYDQNVYADGLLRAKAGDRWVHIFEKDGKPVDGWLAEIHLGVRYVNLTLVDQTPDPDPVPTLPATWDITQVAKDPTGKVLATYKGTLTRE